MQSLLHGQASLTVRTLPVWALNRTDEVTEPPAGQLRLASSATAKFTSDLLVAVSKLFPSSYFSTGGDEINANCYTQDAETQQELNSTGQTFQEALNAFTQQSHSALKKAGKTPVVWEGKPGTTHKENFDLPLRIEMVLSFNATLSPETIALYVTLTFISTFLS